MKDIAQTLAELAELHAKARIPRGPWVRPERKGTEQRRLINNAQSNATVAWIGHGNDATADEIAAYIEALSPSTIAAILDHITLQILHSHNQFSPRRSEGTDDMTLTEEVKQAVRKAEAALEDASRAGLEKAKDIRAGIEDHTFRMVHAFIGAEAALAARSPAPADAELATREDIEAHNKSIARWREDALRKPADAQPTQVGEEVTLGECPIGLFMAGGELCLKTEYGDNNGRIDAYIVSSGEFFWGGTSGAEAQRKVKVRPFDISRLSASAGDGWRTQLTRTKDNLDHRLNEALCEMKEGYDDSVVGFNEAWDIVRNYFKEKIDALPASPSPGDRP